MKKLLYFICLLTFIALPFSVYAGPPQTKSITVQEVDGDPKGFCRVIKFPNGSLTISSGTGIVTYSGGGAETDPIVGAVSGIIKADGGGNISAVTAIDALIIGGTTPAAGSFTTLNASGDATFGASTRVTIKGAADQDGIVFASLGTATKAIDLSGSGLSGSGDYQIYDSVSDFVLRADGRVGIGTTSPSTKLHIYNTLPGESIVIQDNAAGDLALAYIRFKDSSGATLGYLGYGHSSSSTFTIGNEVSNANIYLQTTGASLFGKSHAVGSLTNCESNGSTTITKTSHGLTPSEGDLLHITSSSTPAAEGFYQVQSYGAHTIVVDRVVSGTEIDVSLIIYQDIAAFITDADGNIRITGYQSDNEPLQIGGLTMIGAGGHSLGAEDVLIGGILEVDGTSFFDGDIAVTGAITLTDSTDTHIIKAVQEPGLGGRYTIGLDETARTFVISDTGDIDVDMGFVPAADPKLYITKNADIPTNFSSFTWGEWNLNNGVLKIQGTGNPTLFRNTGSQGVGFYQEVNDVNPGNAFKFYSAAGAELADTDAAQSWVYIEPKINQSSTAAYNALKIKVNETAGLGDGSTGDYVGNTLILAGTTVDPDMFVVDNSGNVISVANIAGATYGSDNSVSDAEFLRINTLASNAQDQITARARLASAEVISGNWEIQNDVNLSFGSTDQASFRFSSGNTMLELVDVGNNIIFFWDLANSSSGVVAVAAPKGSLFDVDAVGTARTDEFAAAFGANFTAGGTVVEGDEDDEMADFYLSAMVDDDVDNANAAETIIIEWDGSDWALILGPGAGPGALAVEDLKVDFKTGTANQILFSSNTAVDELNFSAFDLVTSGEIVGRNRWGADVASTPVNHNTTDLHGLMYLITVAATVNLDAAADVGYGACTSYRIRDAAEAAIIDLDASEYMNLAGTALVQGVGVTATGAGEYLTVCATTDADGSGGDGYFVYGETSGWASE